jgi:hypothetical protein
MPMPYIQNQDKSNNKSWLVFNNELPLRGTEVEDIGFAKAPGLCQSLTSRWMIGLATPPHIGCSPLAH